jgi:hypothetical protein
MGAAMDASREWVKISGHPRSRVLAQNSTTMVRNTSKSWTSTFLRKIRTKQILDIHVLAQNPHSHTKSPTRRREIDCGVA